MASLIKLRRMWALLRAETNILVWWTLRKSGIIASDPDWLIPTPREVLFNLVIPVIYKKLANKYILHVKNAESQLVCVTIKDLGDLYIPSSVLKQLLQIISEQIFPLHWDYPFFGGATICSEDVVVDCGAGEGFFTLIAAKIASRVHAIEPIPAFNMGLMKSFERYNNVIVHEVGASNKTGYITMLDDGIRSRLSTDERVGIKVAVVPLDELLSGEKVTFIKVDVEGMEKEVLEGARNLIAKNKPKLAVAAYHDANDVFELRKLILRIRGDYKIILRGINYKNGLPKFLYAW